MHRCSDAPSVASADASHNSRTEVGLLPPLTQSMWGAAGEQLACCEDDESTAKTLEHFLGFSGLQPRRQPMPSAERYNCQTASAKKWDPHRWRFIRVWNAAIPQTFNEEARWKIYSCNKRRYQVLLLTVVKDAMMLFLFLLCNMACRQPFFFLFITQVCLLFILFSHNYL